MRLNKVLPLCLLFIFVAGCAENTQRQRIYAFLKDKDVKSAIKEYKVLLDMKKGQDDTNALDEICYEIVKEIYGVNEMVNFRRESAINEIIRDYTYSLERKESNDMFQKYFFSPVIISAIGIADNKLIDISNKILTDRLCNLDDNEIIYTDYSSTPIKYTTIIDVKIPFLSYLLSIDDKDTTKYIKDRLIELSGLAKTQFDKEIASNNKDNVVKSVNTYKQLMGYITVVGFGSKEFKPMLIDILKQYFNNYRKSYQLYTEANDKAYKYWAEGDSSSGIMRQKEFKKLSEEKSKALRLFREHENNYLIFREKLSFALHIINNRPESPKERFEYYKMYKNDYINGYHWIDLMVYKNILEGLYFDIVKEEYVKAGITKKYESDKQNEIKKSFDHSINKLNRYISRNKINLFEIDEAVRKANFLMAYNNSYGINKLKEMLPKVISLITKYSNNNMEDTYIERFVYLAELFSDDIKNNKELISIFREILFITIEYEDSKIKWDSDVGKIAKIILYL